MTFSENIFFSGTKVVENKGAVNDKGIFVFSFDGAISNKGVHKKSQKCFDKMQELQCMKCEKNGGYAFEIGD